jgi:hypothetical protein
MTGIGIKSAYKVTWHKKPLRVPGGTAIKSGLPEYKIGEDLIIVKPKH